MGKVDKTFKPRLNENMMGDNIQYDEKANDKNWYYDEHLNSYIPKKVAAIENRAYNLINKWKKWNPYSEQLDRLRQQWKGECEKWGYEPKYTFTDVLA